MSHVATATIPPAPTGSAGPRSTLGRGGGRSGKGRLDHAGTEHHACRQPTPEEGPTTALNAQAAWPGIGSSTIPSAA